MIGIPAAREGWVYFMKPYVYAIIFDPYVPSPVMHRRGPLFKTHCGREFLGEDCRFVDAAIQLRLEHADLFCRPCKKCWP